jgi:hypothetical protein
MKHTMTPHGNLTILRVEADDGRFLIHHCRSQAHAEECIPILERMLDRERLAHDNEASGWRRRLPLHLTSFLPT